MENKKAVLFDVGGVLFSSPVQEIAAYEEELGVPRLTLGRAFAHGAPDNAFCRMERGELTLSQFIPEFEKECHRLAEANNVTFTQGFLAKELFQRITKNVRPHPEMMEAVLALKASGFKTGAITNNWIDDVSSSSVGKLETYLSGYFDVVLESCKLGIRKPDPRIYKKACEMLHIEPAEAVFLDDLGPNLKAAKELGMATIKVADPAVAIAELETVLGISLQDTGTEKEQKNKL